jgi:hypothetical protein
VMVIVMVVRLVVIVGHVKDPARELVRGQGEQFR